MCDLQDATLRVGSATRTPVASKTTLRHGPHVSMTDASRSHASGRETRVSRSFRMSCTGLEPVTPSLSTRSYALRLFAFPAVCSSDSAKERTIGSVFGSGLTGGQNGVCVCLRHCPGTVKALRRKSSRAAEGQFALADVKRENRRVRPELPTGTVTFIFTDIEGSTLLLRELGDGYAEVLAEHHRVLRRPQQRARRHENPSQGRVAEMPLHLDRSLKTPARRRDRRGAIVGSPRCG
jgi:hypothetical protein